jgi:energy-coupling factor transporter ATP-binding protein EcfA2
MTTVLATADRHHIAGLQTYGNWMTRRIAAVLAAKFHHRNADGSIFVPHISSATLYAPWYHVVTLDAEALWHFSADKVTSDAVLNALTCTVNKQVRAITRIPAQGGMPERHGVAFVVTLRDIPALADVPAVPRELPRMNFDAANIPDGKLMVPIGQTESGDLWMPITQVLHLMVVGESGSGKSNFLKAALLALTSRATPAELRIAIISPKRAEFAAFTALPHLWESDDWTRGEIASNSEEATKLIVSLRKEYDRRDILFARCGITNMDDWNARVEPAQRMPRILLMADEVLDLALMAPRGSRMMENLTSLTSVARSHGFHIFLGTTKPRFDVLPSTLTGNIDNRICFRVATDDAARQVKCPGAEHIPAEARGRGIARLDGKLMHFQAFLVGEPQGQRIGNVVMDIKPEVSDVERKLVEWAINENGLYLSVADIQRRAGYSKRQADTLAANWESRNWLVKDRSAGNKRRITDDLIALIDQ